MGIVISPSSELGKELRRWEQHHTQYALTEDGDSKPGNPYVFRPYPRMLYKAFTRPNGKVQCMDEAPNRYLYPTDDAYARAEFEVEQFNKSCQRIVHSDREEAEAKQQGWRNAPQEAVDVVEGLARDIANAAAEANYAASRMSDAARAEFAAAHETTHEHIVDVVGTKRGRKPKVVAGSGPVES